MFISFLLILVGLVVLVAGAESLVRGASGLARLAGLSPLVIGLTVVAFGTSAPELAVSVKATFGGAGDLSIGNIAGSNLFNVAVILGISALVCPLAVNLQVIKLDMPVMLAASVLFILFCLTGGELVIAGGSAVLGQKLLETIFGEDAVRRLAAEARRDLQKRTRALFDTERARVAEALEPVKFGSSPESLRRESEALLDDVRRAAEAGS